MTEKPASEQTAEGYDIPAVEAWVRENVTGLTPPFKWTRLEGGHSNLTYRLDDANGKSAVIRRPPQGVLLPKAHDMSREWSLISALGPTAVPVPEAIGFCESPDVTGAWFYIMGLIDGQPLYAREETLARIPEDKRPAMAFDMVDALANLHSLDPDEIGLSGLGKTDSYVGRQLKTWYRSWMASIEPAKFDDPRAHELHDYFSKTSLTRARPVWCMATTVCTMCSSVLIAGLPRLWTGKFPPLAIRLQTLPIFSIFGQKPKQNESLTSAAPARLASQGGVNWPHAMLTRLAVISTSLTTMSASTAGNPLPSYTAFMHATWRAKKAPTASTWTA